jgi:hypothetical protein
LGVCRLDRFARILHIIFDRIGCSCNGRCRSILIPLSRRDDGHGLLDRRVSGRSMLILIDFHGGGRRHERKQPISADQCTDGGNRAYCAHSLPTLLTLKLRALLTLKRQLKLLTLAFQLPIVSRPLLRLAEAGVGGDNVPEPRRSIRIAGMEIGMVRLECRAERFLKSFFVVIRTRTKRLAKRFHRGVLSICSKEPPENSCMFSVRQIRAANYFP